MKKLFVSDKCVACGSCVMMCDLLEEKPDGKAFAKESCKVTEQNLHIITEVINSCPVQAISIVESSLVKSNGGEGLKELSSFMYQKIGNYSEALPVRKEYYFDKKEYALPMPGGSGEYNYDYKSDDRAVQAGLREFDRVMYSQKRALIQQLLVEFKHKKLKKYAYYEKVDGNYYYETNKKIKKILTEIIDQAKEICGDKLKLPEGFNEFEIIPHFGYSDEKDGEIVVYQLRHFEELWFVDNIINELNDLSWYDTYIDTDDREDQRGRDVYCYKNIYKVSKMFASDILDETSYILNNSDELEDVLRNALCNYTEAVEKEVQDRYSILSNKIDELKNEIIFKQENSIDKSNAKMLSKKDKAEQEIYLLKQVKDCVDKQLKDKLSEIENLKQNDSYIVSPNRIRFEERSGNYYYDNDMKFNRLIRSIEDYLNKQLKGLKIKEFQLGSISGGVEQIQSIQMDSAYENLYPQQFLRKAAMDVFHTGVLSYLNFLTKVVKSLTADIDEILDSEIKKRH